MAFEVLSLGVRGRGRLDGVSVSSVKRGFNRVCFKVSLGGSALAAVGGGERKVSLLIGSGDDAGKARIVAVDKGGRRLVRVGARDVTLSVFIRASVFGIEEVSHPSERPEWRVLPDGAVEFDLPKWAVKAP